MKEQFGGGKRHSSTRRKFLEFLGTATGLLLTSCGHGFVKPINETEDPLIIELTDQEKQLLSFVSTLPKDHALRSQFIENPFATLVQHNIVPQDSRLNISKANRLLFYLVGNTELSERLGAIVQRYPALSQIQNVVTNDRLDVRFLREVEKDLTSPDSLWKRVIEDQVNVLLSDPKVREILELKIEDSQIREYASRLAAAISGNLSKAEVRPTAVYFFINFRVVANANWKVNANVHYNVNTNLNVSTNANFNYNANYNYNGNTRASGDSIGSHISAEWIQFVDLFTRHAQELTRHAQEQPGL
jgi:hypothetical protein